MPFTLRHIQLLDGATSVNTESQWVTVWNMEDVTIHIYDLSTGGITIYGSNEKVDDPTSEIAIGSEQTADAIVRPDEIPFQLMAKLTTGDDNGNGGAKALLCGRIP